MTALAWLSARHAPTNAAATAGGTKVRSAIGIASMLAASAPSEDVPDAAAVTNDGMAILSEGLPTPAPGAADRTIDADASTGVRAGDGAEVEGMSGAPEVAHPDTGALTVVGDARGTRGEAVDGRLGPHAERTCTTRGVTALAGGAPALGVTFRGLPQAERTCTTWR